METNIQFEQTITKGLEPVFENPQVKNMYERYMGFPNITYREFLSLPTDLREEIVQKNRLLQTDTYNRTMNYIKGENWKMEETYVLQMRKSPAGYLIAYGIRNQIEKMARMRITQAELDFAKEFYAQANVNFFNHEMWQMVIDKYDGFLPLEIEAVDDGTAVLPGDPILKIKGPGEIVAHFEPWLHRIFYSTLVATSAHEIATTIGANRFIEVGMRGTPNEEMHLAATAAMYAGGGIFLTSDDASAACYKDLKDVGTLGHRFIQFYPQEEDAFEQAILNTEATSLLIDLLDSWKGIDKAIELKRKYRESGKKIWIRLDSGDITAQTLYVLEKYAEMGFTDPVMDKVVVEDISNVNDMIKIDTIIKEKGFDPKSFVIYGAGGVLVTQGKERNTAASAFKLSKVENRHTMKFSSDEGKQSIPGDPTIILKEDGSRVIAQKGEYPNSTELFTQIYLPGYIQAEENPAYTRNIVEQSFAQIEKYIGTRTPLSEKTKQSIAELRKHYGMEA